MGRSSILGERTDLWKWALKNLKGSEDIYMPCYFLFAWSSLYKKQRNGCLAPLARDLLVGLHLMVLSATRASSERSAQGGGHLSISAYLLSTWNAACILCPRHWLYHMHTHLSFREVHPAFCQATGIKCVSRVLEHLFYVQRSINMMRSYVKKTWFL